MKSFYFTLITYHALGCLAQSSNKQFPNYFKFGVATSSYQIEGGWNEGGKGVNVWDLFTHQNGTIEGNTNGDVACDSYHKWKEDVEILTELGVQIYRFSISWARILPDGTTNRINEEGVEYYLNLLKELKANNVEPMITLYHWDLPQNLEKMGGWLNPSIAKYFGAYARVCYERFGEYVTYWMTLNEPLTQCSLGYGTGVFAPGVISVAEGPYQCGYVQLLAHAEAYHIYDQEFRAIQQGKIGFSVPYSWTEPLDPNNPLDVEATERHFQFRCGVFANPVYIGNWPQLVIDRVGNLSAQQGYASSRLPKFTPEEVEYIRGTSDFMALNAYSADQIAYLEDESPVTPSVLTDLNVQSLVKDSWVKSNLPWLVSYPEGLRLILNKLNDRYNPKEIIITENGWSDDGGLNDTMRQEYMQGHLNSILEAITEDGIHVTGYTTWSLMDNFEWQSGYTKKFGIVEVDFNDPNRTRTWKNSAYWYKDVIKNRFLANVKNCS